MWRHKMSRSSGPNRNLMSRRTTTPSSRCACLLPRFFFFCLGGPCGGARRRQKNTVPLLELVLMFNNVPSLDDRRDKRVEQRLDTWTTDIRHNHLGVMSCLPQLSFAETSNSSMPFSRPHSCSSSRSSSSAMLLLLLSPVSFPCAEYFPK